MLDKILSHKSLKSLFCTSGDLSIRFQADTPNQSENGSLPNNFAIFIMIQAYVVDHKNVVQILWAYPTVSKNIKHLNR